MTLAVALQLNGFTVVLERKSGEKLVTFCFNPGDAGRTGELTDLVADYESRELLVEPRAFMRAQKQVRELLYTTLGVREGRQLNLRT
jgi:hypothetical protein